MAFLQPDILPAMAEAMHRQLAEARGARLKRATLQDSVVPSGLRRAGNSKLFDDTLRELLGIGALEAKDDDICLPDVSGAREPGAMARIVRAQAMATEREADLWERDASGSLVLTGARDLVRALAWFLNLNVLTGPFDFLETTPNLTNLQDDHLGERPIFNIERWRPFVRWARYLGFVSDYSLYGGSGSSTAAVFPDPSQAIAAVLPVILNGDWVPLESVVSRLAEELPVLDGGVYRRAIIERGAPEAKADCSPTLTLALRTLEAGGVIELQEGIGDAPKLTLADNVGAYHAVRMASP
jgi:hypothetical protein